jgi:hypothetical protein
MSKSVTLDARKVVKYINDSTQSQIRVIEESLSRLGEKTGQKYKLVATHPKNLLFEDSNGQYYLADYAKSRGNRIVLSNITELTIEESKKSHIFNNTCVDLVESICNEDSKAAEIAFKKLESCRFRSTVSSSDGWVTTRDGARRRFMTESNTVAKESLNTIVETISKAIGEEVILEGNRVVRAKLGNIDLKLPINETMRRCNIAKKMKVVAEGAWESTKFQGFVNGIAGLISDNMLNEAVAESAKFLKEFQEFSLLNLVEMEALVENTLATKNQYNPLLAENTALVLYKTNARANRDDIIDTWSQTARIAADPDLMESVTTLSESEDFNNDYQEFLHKVLVEGTEIPQDVLTKFLVLIKTLLSKEIEELEDSAEASGVDPDTVDAVQSALGGESEVMESKIIAEEEDPMLAKYKRARDEIEAMIKGVDAGDPDQTKAATDLVSSIDETELMAADNLQNYGADTEVDEMDSGDMGEIADELDSEEGEEEGLGGDIEDELGGDLGGDLGDLGDLGGDEELGDLGEEDLGDMGDLGEEGEGEEGEEDLDLGTPDLEFESAEKDPYGDHTITEAEINDEYGSSSDDDNINEIVSDLRNMFESENPYAEGGPEDKENTEAINEKEDESEEDEESDSDKPFPGAAEPFGEGKDDIDREVISGNEGVKAVEGAPEDSMNKDNGGDIPGESSLEKDDSLGNKGSDSDLEDHGEALDHNHKNDDKSTTIGESLSRTPTFGKGPFKKVK